MTDMEDKMDFTFMTMHDLGPYATILYASKSISEVLGWDPREVIGRSAFEYFKPEKYEVSQQEREEIINGDRASVLRYIPLRRKSDGIHINCECVITVVYQVLVVCTSLYQEQNPKIHERARTVPLVASQFHSQRDDPRYEMIAHLSPKFEHSPVPIRHEPRAAMILNRFTRTLNCMYATSTLNDILGLRADEAVGCSFYEFISPDCLQDCVDALEAAKANDSIAYLRFRWRDPRDESERLTSSRTSSVASASTSVQSEDGGVRLRSESATPPSSPSPSYSSPAASSAHASSTHSGDGAEVEAVISCTSDGLVVILCRAQFRTPYFAAAPWAPRPVIPRGPAPENFMNEIQQQAVFAWSLRSLNQNVRDRFARGEREPDSVSIVGYTRRANSGHERRLEQWREHMRKNPER